MIIHRISLFLLLFSLLVSLSITGCKSASEKKSESASSGAAGDKAEKDDAGLDKIKVFNADGKPILKLKEKNYGYKLYTISGNEQTGQQPLGKLKFNDEGGVKVEDPNGQDLFKLKVKEDKIKVEDGAGKLLYEVKFKDGDLKLEDPEGQTIYKMKKEDYGYKLTDGNDKLLFKVKQSNARVVVESPDGKSAMEVKGIDNVLAVSALALEKLNEQQRAALMVLLNRKGNSW
jgi:hypothetical protein